MNYQFKQMFIRNLIFVQGITDWPIIMQMYRDEVDRRKALNWQEWFPPIVTW